MCCYYFYLTVKNNGSKIQVKESYRTGLRARPDRPISQARLPATARTAGLHFVLRSGFKKAQQFYNNKRSSEKNNSDNFWKSFLFCVIFKINFGHKKKVGRKCFTKIPMGNLCISSRLKHLLYFDKNCSEEICNTYLTSCLECRPWCG